MPLLGASMQDRNAAFQQLKPPCVALSQAALALNGPSPNIKTVAGRLEELKRELCAVTNSSSSLDVKLADYVFFPLSQVLKASQRVSIRCLELTFQCLAILIDKGWRSRTQPQLAAQIVILCTMMADKNPKGLASTESTDELRASALWCLCHLFSVVDSAEETKAALTSEANFPQLGQTISTVLDAIVDTVTAEIQMAATQVLLSMAKNVATRDIKASFLPGIVSKLTKVLTPQTRQRRTHAVLTGSLDVLQILFIDTLSDSATDLDPGESKGDAKAKQSSVINEQWLENAAAQLKPAIASILKLKDHSRYDVREALARFCFVILQQCRKTLANCGSLALETVLFLSSGQMDVAIKFRLESLAQGDDSVSKLMQSTLFDWLQSLPTQMQAADEQTKVQRLQQITTAYGIVLASGVGTNAIDRLLATVLRDSVVVTIQPPRSSHQNVQSVSPVQSLDLALLGKDRNRTEFSHSLVKYKGQQEVIAAIGQVLKLTASSSSSSNTFAADLSRSLRQSRDESQVATFWLLLNVVETSVVKDQMDAYIDLENEQLDGLKEHLEDLFAFSLAILTDTTDEPIDPRLQSLALRTLALKARIGGDEFRYDLIEALYPILHTLATPNEDLQTDSIATLNIVASACEYNSVQDLIVDNVDYLTNSVALKLNAFDVSPQAPQVLLMMVRLAGPKLLPYLEDTIESIFAALRDYHGYPLLVELLFKVLSVVAEEGARDPQLAIADSKTRKLLEAGSDTWRPTDMESLVELLAERSKEKPQGQPREQPKAHPQRPWKDDETEQQSGEDDEQEYEVPAPTDIETPPPAPKVYGLLLKISELTQHFLPSASASLRLSLLTLIKTSTPAIARHENSFLPLINTLWPEIVSRLDDPEPSVVASALDIVALLCENAGDFMRSRILQLWPNLIEIYERISKDIVRGAHPTAAPRPTLERGSSNNIVSDRALLKQAVTRMQSTPADYIDTSNRLVWTSLLEAITVAVQYAQLSPDHFDEALAMLDPVLEQLDIREALEVQNPDAVWLARIRNGGLPIPEMPAKDVNARWQFAAVAG